MRLMWRRWSINPIAFITKNATDGKRVATGLLAGALILLGAGCRQDMHNQPKFKPLRASTFYADQRSSRPIIEGTIARGQLKEDRYYYTGMNGTIPGEQFPFPVTKEVVERGHERFNIYCTPCHSKLGDGNGMIVQRGLKRPPSFHDPRLVKSPVGHFFDVMTNGFGAMPDYSAQISVRDRWAIIAYIRALQLSQNATADDVPAGVQVSDNKPDLNVPSEQSSDNTKGQHGTSGSTKEEPK
jgi:mono/diheme cytochrome c family protein